MATIERGHIYRAKKPRRIMFGFDGVYDDRQVLHVGPSTVQYDSSTVRDGRRYPSVSRENFEKWMGSDVTEGYPKGDWASLSLSKKGALSDGEGFHEEGHGTTGA